MSGARHRRKGERVEREILSCHQALGIHAARYPLSGAKHRDVRRLIKAVRAEARRIENAPPSGDHA